ncbi:hypothetical protein ILYODFUR_022771 [Ilyodon furcidens]|uniref:Secreted protein n=1 Tax=Ilyodon furcidens TaxID=33524 RepID=A0ABV0TE76_9TELE
MLVFFMVVTMTRGGNMMFHLAHNVSDWITKRQQNMFCCYNCICLYHATEVQDCFITCSSVIAFAYCDQLEDNVPISFMTFRSNLSLPKVKMSKKPAGCSITI